MRIALFALLSTFSLLPAAALAAPAPAAPPPAGLHGTIDAVTVYRGQALVTRVVDIPGPAGLHEIVVTDLPQQVDPSSIYAESAEGVEVRSVLYRERALPEDARDEVRKLDDELQKTDAAIAANTRHS